MFLIKRSVHWMRVNMGVECVRVLCYNHKSDCFSVSEETNSNMARGRLQFNYFFMRYLISIKEYTIDACKIVLYDNMKHIDRRNLMNN